jgi:hypothetical protein
MSYQGPNVSVTQKFLATPPATAVENLPPAGIGTAYDVYAKESLGTSFGISDNEFDWGVSDVIWSESVIGDRLYNFYPVVVYANTTSGDIALDVTKSSSAVTVDKDQDYTVPNTEQLSGYCEAFIPFYSKNLGTGMVQILATDLTTVIATGASFSTSKLQAGQSVIAGNAASPSSFVLLGTVAAVGSDETKIKLTQAYSTTVSFDTIIVGVSTSGGDGAFDDLTHANCLYDPNADFIGNKVKVGDVVNFQSNALSTTITYQATVTSIVNKNMLQFNTIIGSQYEEDYDFYSYFPHYGGDQATPGTTVSISTYYISRLVGFSQNYGFESTATTPKLVVLSPASFAILVSAGLPLLSKGDYISATTAPITTLPTGISFHQIETAIIGTVTLPGTTTTTTTTSTTSTTAAPTVYYQIYTTVDIITDESSGAFVATDYVSAWHPIITNNILADFRAVRSEELQVVHRITSEQDIVTAWCKDDEISPYNELAFGMLCAFSASGGNVCYGVNINSTETNLSAEYAEAMESLKMYDVYSHFLCTTDGGVNALMSPYCAEQSAPYEAHERIGVLCYDSQDVYLQGVGTGTIASNGLISIASGTMNLPVIGVTKEDEVEIYDDDGVYKETVTVIATPSTTEPTKCYTDGENSYSGATMTFKFMSNRKDDQAIRIAALSASDRRVSIIWPGWFNATIGTTAITLPPYYIAAAITGMDSGNNPSQSFTNKNFSLPGISNIQLGTNTYFKKSQLDVIGGGGIDIMIQDVSPSAVIKSRHDLTTNMDAVEYRERSITKQADSSAKTLRTSINPYVGKYNITQSLLTFIGQVCSIVASTLVKNGIIANMSIVSIARDANIADKINIAVTITVFVAGNYYDIQMLVVSR